MEIIEDQSVIITGEIDHEEDELITLEAHGLIFITQKWILNFLTR
jgi:hypothetical protein